MDNDLVTQCHLFDALLAEGNPSEAWYFHGLWGLGSVEACPKRYRVYLQDGRDDRQRGSSESVALWKKECLKRGLLLR